MPISIRNPKAEELARKAAEHSGKGITQVIMDALEGHLRKLHIQQKSHVLFEEIMDISRRCCSLPDTDKRSVWDIINDIEPGDFV